MANYRMVAQVRDHKELLRTLESQVYAWVRHKNLPADKLERGLTDLGSAQAVWVDEQHVDGSRVSRFRMREDRGWITTLTAETPADSKTWERGSVWLDVHAPAESDFSAVPRLARYIVKSLDAADGLATLTAEPILIREPDVDRLIDVLCDEDRRGLVFVAGTHEELAFDEWRRMVGNLTEQTVGMASAYLLDRQATQRLSEELGERYATLPATIRTYFPGVDPASRVDSRRHRILGTQTLAERPEGSLRGTLAWAAREQQDSVPLPRHLTRLGTRLGQQENKLLIAQNTQTVPAAAATPPDTIAKPDTTAPEPTAGGSVGAPDAPVGPVSPPAAGKVARSDEADTGEQVPTGLWRLLTDGVSSLLGRVPSAESLRSVFELARHGKASQTHLPQLESRLDELTLENERLIEERDAKQEKVEDYQLELAEQIDEATDLQDLVTHLRKRLLQGGLAEAAYEPVPADGRAQPPENYDELLRAISEKLSRVVFTGDAAKCQELQQHDPLASWAAKAWSALLALDGYARAKAEQGFTGSFHTYLDSDSVDGRKISQKSYKASESETVANQWRNERVLPVPRTIHPKGEVYMEAHIALGTKRSISPRLYFYDATGRDGKVYVGYIGRHLTNTKT